MNRAAAAAFLAVLTTACGGEGRVDAGLPEGALVYGSRVAVERLLECASQFRGSVVAERAMAKRAEIGTCAFVSAAAPSASEAFENLSCASDGHPLASRGEAGAIAFALPTAEGRRAVGTLRVASDGRFTGQALVDSDPEGSASDLFVGGGDPGPAVLNDDEAFFHVRLKPSGGIDLASLTPPESQASKMFRLRNSLFAGALFDATWEAALYLSEPDHSAPRMSAALGIRSRDAARAAMESFVTDVQSQWDVTRTDFSALGFTGACFRDLNLLPRLAPCYVVTDRALVLGWDSGSVEHALARNGASVQGFVLDASALTAADARIAEAETRRGRTPGDAPIDYPWGRIRASGEREGRRVRWTFESSGGCR